jgi:uncharacterized protein (TIGR02996 family)
MSPDNPFLKALLAQPEDDTLRLAMADWFDENEQPGRAEFIRLQVELARGVDDRDRRRHLEFRQRDLLIAHDTEWVQPLAEVLGCEPGRWGGWVFRRGFVEYFRLSVDQLGACYRLAELTPLRELNLEGQLSDDLARVMVESPCLARVRIVAADWRSLSSPMLRRFSRRFGAVILPTG